MDVTRAHARTLNCHNPFHACKKIHERALWEENMSENYGFTGLGFGATNSPNAERCRSFMEKQGWKKIERLANGQDQAKKRPDLMLLAMRLVCEYAYGRPPKRKPLAPSEMP